MSAFAWGVKVSPEFRARVTRMATRLGLDPSWLMAVMAFETGRTFSPSVKNPGSSAIGLIQFMAATAIDLGTTVEKLAAMSAVEQLDYVDRYLSRYRGRMRTLSDVYMAVLWPAGIGKAEDAVIFQPGSRQYLANKGLDINHDGAVTKAEAARFVAKALAEGLRPENATVPDRTRPERSAIATKSTETTMPLVPILISLIPEVLKLFAPRVQAEVSRATGADPEVSAQFMQSLVDKIAGMPVTTAPQAIAAVASVVDAPPEQQAEKVAELESFSLDYIEKVAPLLDRIAAMEEREWSLSEESQDRAAARYKGAEFDPSRMLTYFAIGAVALITVFLGGWITLFLAQKAPVTVEMWAAFTGLIGWLTAKAGSIYDNRFGTTRQSAAKDVIIGELAQRR